MCMHTKCHKSAFWELSQKKSRASRPWIIQRSPEKSLKPDLISTANWNELRGLLATYVLISVEVLYSNIHGHDQRNWLDSFALPPNPLLPNSQGWLRH